MVSGQFGAEIANLAMSAVASGTPGRVLEVPISQISTFTSRWTVRAKVVEKTVQQFNRAGNGQSGQLLITDLMDIQGDIIRAKFWNGAAEKFGELLQKDQIYTFKGGKVTVANKRYNNTPHGYEITFYEGTAEIAKSDEDNDGQENVSAVEGANAVSGGTPVKAWPKKPKEVGYRFAQLRDIKTMNRELPFMTDLLCVVHSVKEVEEVTSKKSGEKVKRRNLTVVDSTEHELEVTLWMPHATTIDEAQLADHPTIAFRSLQIREWRGRVGATSSMTTVSVGPEIEEAKTLATWYQRNAATVYFQPLKSEGPTAGPQVGGGSGDSTKEASLSKVFDEVSEMDPGSEQQSYLTYALTSKLYHQSREGAFVGIFPACPKCRKKVADDSGDAHQMRCENCNTSVTPAYRFMMAMSLIDNTRGRFVIRSFHESCANLFGVEASEVHKLVEASTSGSTEAKQKLDSIFEYQALWQRVRVRMRGRREVYNGQSRNNVVMTSLDKVNLDAHCTSMLRDIWALYPEARKTARSRETAPRSDSKASDNVEEDCHQREILVAQQTSSEKKMDPEATAGDEGCEETKEGAEEPPAKKVKTNASSEEQQSSAEQEKQDADGGDTDSEEVAVQEDKVAEGDGGADGEKEENAASETVNREATEDMRMMPEEADAGKAAEGEES